MLELIEKKRDGVPLSTKEIEFFISNYTAGEIPDYQVAALLMAIIFQGMDDREVRDLTLAMARSGDQLNLSGVAPRVVDKHSTGGVGDKVSLVVGPMVAACGLPVGKMSGRGLGFTGGTLDKLESIPGFHVDLSVEEFKAQLQDVGLVIAGQSARLAPADGKLYALRDVTGTVASLPLIVSSIMSKKLAAGADAIVLDVKVGTGAFMKELENAKALAEAMVRIGEEVGRKVTALISDMNQPLGHAVGNAIEVREAIETLQGGGPSDFYEHCLAVAGEMLYLGGQADDLEAAKVLAASTLDSGAAWEKFREMVAAQGGDLAYVDDPQRLPKAEISKTLTAAEDEVGYLSAVQAAEIGLAVVELGGGREEKGQPIDHAVGVMMSLEIGDEVAVGDPLFTVHANDEATMDAAVARIREALTFSKDAVEQLPLFYDRVV
jgi:pyrimidine-nucleoside phosphorylase